MSRFLFAPETFNLAETTRMIGVASALSSEHEVLFIGYSKRYAHLVTEAGFELRLLEPELSDEEADQLIRADQGRGLRHPFTVSMVRTRVGAERQIFTEFRPLAAVIGTTFTLLISARAENVPLAYVKPFAYSGPHLEHATRLPVLIGTGPVAALVNRVAALSLRALARRLTFLPRSFRVAAAENNVALPKRTFDALDADLNLITTLPHFVGDAVLPDDFRVVGPVFARLDTELSAEVIELSRQQRPVVYFAMGSSGNRRLVMRFLRSLGQLDVTVIAPVDSYLTDADRAALAPNILVTELLPAHKIAPYIDVSIIHGGEGTVQTACAGGKPFIGVGLQLEQRINLDACERFGNALRIAPRDATASRLRALISTVQQPRFIERATRMKELVDATAGSDAAAQHVVELAGSGNGNAG